ncbi:MAG: hypothetical protein HDT32_02960 [Clostridiales bacterium]|nr:hypothetical protein [Clostridiales bacterium]
MDKISQYTCLDCIENRNGNCFGENKTCIDFKYAPTVSQETMDNWPKTGDATFMRQTGRSRNNN